MRKKGEKVKHRREEIDVGGEEGLEQEGRYEHGRGGGDHERRGSDIGNKGACRRRR